MVILAPIAAMLVQMAISRTREYAADRGGAEISQRPMALASALAQDFERGRANPEPTAEGNPATAHLFIINPLSGARMDNLFSTHPATENRIAALEQIAQRMVQHSGSGDADGPLCAALAPGHHRKRLVSDGERALGPELTPRDTSDELRRRDARLGRTRGRLQVGLPARRASVELLVRSPGEEAIAGRGARAARSPQAWLLNLPQRDRAFDAGDHRDVVASTRGRSIMCSLRFLSAGCRRIQARSTPFCFSAAAQLIFLKIPAHAVIDLAVTARAIRCARQALRQACQCRVAARRQGGRGGGRR